MTLYPCVSLVAVRGGWLVSLISWDDDDNVTETLHTSSSVDFVAELIRTHLVSIEAEPEITDSVERQMRLSPRRRTQETGGKD